MIQPHDDWSDWNWTAEAEALHGLTRDQVMREGLPAEQVLAELIYAAEGCRIVADSVIDQYWLQTLAAAAGAPAPFMIDHVSLLLDEYRAGERRITAAIAHANSLCPRRHRAAGDALWLSSLLDHVTNRVEAGRPALA